MKSMWYVEDGRGGVRPVPLETWTDEFFRRTDRRVALTRFFETPGRISTVFLALDHSWTEGEPILYETMVFGIKKYDEYMDRYQTRFDALAGHADWVKRIVALGFKPKNPEVFQRRNTHHARRPYHA